MFFGEAVERDMADLFGTDEIGDWYLLDGLLVDDSLEFCLDDDRPGDNIEDESDIPAKALLFI